VSSKRASFINMSKEYSVQVQIKANFFKKP